MTCIWCHQAMKIDINWKTVLYPSKPQLLCDDCKLTLVRLSGEGCQLCSRESKEGLCSDCMYWMDLEKQYIEYNHSIYTYNDQMKQMIAKWKYRGDYIIGSIFKEVFISEFTRKFANLMNSIQVVPIPLSETRLMERKFNQAQMLADFLPVENKPTLIREHSEKQAKKTRYERMNTKNPFKVIGEVQDKVILIDDIYTTGATLRHAAKQLIKSGCKEVYSYTLIRG